jgi:hypothetical protein
MRRRMLDRVLKAWRTNKGILVKLESKSDSISRLFRSPEAGLTKTDTKIASGHHFECSTYEQNAKRIYFQMKLVTCQNSSGVNRNHQYIWMSRIYLSETPLYFVLWAVYCVRAQ